MLFIRTMAEKGMELNLCGRGWKKIAPVPNDHVVDWEGAGDWTSSVVFQKEKLNTIKMFKLKRLFIEASHTAGSVEMVYLRPDVILHLDQKREVIIDSKVSLTAFFDYVNAENEADRQRYLKAHVESLQKHVKELAKKDYSS